MLETIKTYILGEWRMIASFPISFIMAIAIATVLIWVALSWACGGVISHQAAEIKLLERQKGGPQAPSANNVISSDQKSDRSKLTVVSGGHSRMKG